MAQPQAASWQQLLDSSGFDRVARLVLGRDTDRPFVLVPPHIYSKLAEAADRDTPGHKHAAARGSGNDDNDEHNSDESAGTWESTDQEVLQLLARNQSCTLQDLRLIPDKTADNRQGGQWTADARKWPELIVFAVPSPLSHSAAQQQVNIQHMSLVMLFNAPALGQSIKASTQHSQQAPDGRAMLLHLDPHSREPHPDCKNKQFGCSRCKSCVFQGAEPAAVLLPMLMMLQRVIRREGEAFRQGSRGRRNKMQQCDFCSSADHGDHLDLFSVPVPPMLPLCMTATTKLAAVPGQPCCQCVGSCLVMLDWLSAWPPGQHDLDSRAAAVWNRSLQPWRVLPLSPAWYPPMYVDLLIRDLQALTDLAQQQVQQQQQQQQREEPSGRRQQQQQSSAELQSLWKQVQQSRLRSGQLCYPGPLGHLAMLKQLTIQQMQQLWLAGFSWSEGHMLGSVQHLQRTVRVHTAHPNDGASSSAAAAAAPNEAVRDCEALAALMLPAITSDERRLSIQVCDKLAAGCQQFSAVPWRAIAGMSRSTAQRQLQQLTVVQARAQRYMPKQKPSQDVGGQATAAGQQTPDDPQPGEQSSRQQGQPGEAGVDDVENEGGAGGGCINDDQDQYPDWRAQSSGSEEDGEAPWCHSQQQQQQQQCQQQQQKDGGGAVADVDDLNAQYSLIPDSTAAQAPDQHWRQEQQTQQRPLPDYTDPQHQVEQLQVARESQQTTSTSAAAQSSLRQAIARSQAGAGSAAAAPRQSTAVAEQACQQDYPGRKGSKAGGNSCIQQQQQQQQQQHRRQQARQCQGAVPATSHKRRRGLGDTGKAGQCAHSDGVAAGLEMSPPRHNQQPMALQTTPALLRQHLVPKAALKQQQQQQQSHERCTPPKAANSSPAGSMTPIANSPYCHQKTTGTAAAAGQSAGKRAAGAVWATAPGQPTTHPNGSPAGLPVTKGAGCSSGGRAGHQTQASAAAQLNTPGSHRSKASAQLLRAQATALANLIAKSPRPRGHNMGGWEQ